MFCLRQGVQAIQRIGEMTIGEPVARAMMAASTAP
jgi:hypothetical protein